MRTYTNRYRHTQIFLGWNTSFYAGNQRWTWKLGTKYRSAESVERAILERFPDAVDIKLYKIMSEE